MSRDFDEMLHQNAVHWSFVQFRGRGCFEFYVSAVLKLISHGLNGLTGLNPFNPWLTFTAKASSTVELKNA
jgi:hypothetical protein